MRLIIRRFRNSDLQVLYELLADPEVMEHLEEPFSFARTESFLREKGLGKDPEIYAVDEEAGRFAGYVIYHGYDDTHKEIGWVLRRSLWNRGYASRLTSTLTDMAFRDGKDVIIECSKKQEATRKIAEKQGFSLVGEDGDLCIYELRRSSRMLEGIDEELHRYIEDEVLREYEGYERSHGPEHIRTVIANALELAKEQDADPNMIYTIAAYHDIGIRYGRDDHEKTSARWLMKDRELDRWFSADQKIVMSEAIEDHRASSFREPRSLYGRIIAEADRDIDPERVIRRCVEYESHAHEGASDDEKLRHIIRHINKKYGPKGYLKLYLSSRKNEEGLKTIRSWIADGTLKERCRRCLKELNNE